MELLLKTSQLTTNLQLLVIALKREPTPNEADLLDSMQDPRFAVKSVSVSELRV